MTRPLSIMFLVVAILLGQAGALDLQIKSPVDGYAPGSGAHASGPTEDEALDPCLNGGISESTKKAEHLFAHSRGGVF